MIIVQGLISAPNRILEGSGYIDSAPYRILEGKGFMNSASYRILEGSGFMDCIYGYCTLPGLKGSRF